jgi:hypothetical protein
MDVAAETLSATQRIPASEVKKTLPLMQDLKRKCKVDTETAIADRVAVKVTVAAVTDKVVAATEVATTEVAPEREAAVAVATVVVLAVAAPRSRLLLKAKLVKFYRIISDSRL